MGYIWRVFAIMIERMLRLLKQFPVLLLSFAPYKTLPVLLGYLGGGYTLGTY